MQCSCVYIMRTSTWSSASYRVNEYLCGTSIKQKERSNAEASESGRDAL